GPGGRGYLGDEDIALVHLVKLAGSMNHTRDSGDLARACADALDGVALLLVGARRRPLAPVEAEEPRAPLLRQKGRRRALALAFPFKTALFHFTAKVGHWLIPVHLPRGRI